VYGAFFIGTKKMEQLPSIAGIEITTDEHGRFNLNAIHRASGLGDSKRPTDWLRTNQAQELIIKLSENSHLAQDSTNELTENLRLAQDTTSELSGNSRLAYDVINVQKGGSSPGTFAHEILAVEYAGWISPDFRITVNQTFIDYRKGVLPVLPVLAPTLPKLVLDFNSSDKIVSQLFQ